MPMLPWLIGNCQALSTAFLIDVFFFSGCAGVVGPWTYENNSLARLFPERERERASETSIHVFQNHRMFTMKTSSQGPAASRTRCKRRRTQLP